MNKFTKLTNRLSKYYGKPINFNLSPAISYRSRCEFGYKDNYYTMIKDDKKIYFKTHNLPSSSIQSIMEPLLDLIEVRPVIKRKLFQINFRSIKDTILVTLIYHKDIDDQWLDEAKIIASSLNINLIGRARKKLLSTGMIELEELVDVKDNFYLYQDDKTFYQPNKYLMPKMIEFSLSLISNPRDLLELYCGSGTFTVPMSRYFNKIFATENNRASIGYLNKSIDRNNIINISQSRLSDTELTEAFNGRIFRRMNDISLDDYDFSHVLVDPPRSGLNENVVNILNRFENIIYISCNPETFERDIINLKGYKIDKLEVFDQFSNTPHLELIALLTRI